MAGGNPESAQIADAPRRGDPFVVYADANGHERVLSMPEEWTRVTIGRGMSADVSLSWDAGVSSLHADLQHLADGDELRFGSTAIRFRAPFQVVDRTEIEVDRPPGV